MEFIRTSAMTVTSATPRAADSLGDLLDRLGEISPFRVRMRPAPGNATEADVLASGPDGMMRLFPQLVRSPDVAFVSRARLAEGHMPKEAIPNLVPDLAVEVLSESNTPREMLRKRQDYFRAGVRLAWVFDPDARAVDVFTAPENPATTLGAGHG
jgi:hypothetical protein